jgi:hypothetical protein
MRTKSLQLLSTITALRNQLAWFRRGDSAAPDWEEVDEALKDAHGCVSWFLQNADPMQQVGNLPHVKHSPTSKGAGDGVGAAKATERHRALWKALRRRGQRGGTDEEMATELGWSGNSLRPTRVWLRDRGFVVDSGEERSTRSGCKAAVWVAITGRDDDGFPISAFDAQQGLFGGDA